MLASRTPLRRAYSMPSDEPHPHPARRRSTDGWPDGEHERRPHDAAAPEPPAPRAREIDAQARHRLAGQPRRLHLGGAQVEATDAKLVSRGAALTATRLSRRVLEPAVAKGEHLVELVESVVLVGDDEHAAAGVALRGQLAEQRACGGGV